MLFRSALLSVVVANAAANSIFGKPINEIGATSELGNRLLSKSRLLNGDNDDANEQDNTWVAGYSLKFERCLQSFQWGNKDNGDGNGNNDNGNNNNDGSDQLSIQHLVEYRLCPSGSCSSGCENGAAYAVAMEDFIVAYMETKMQAAEEACEVVRENCYCNNDDQEACEEQCYTDAGLDDCVKDEDDEEFDAEIYTQCTANERKNNNENGNNNQNYNRYYRYYRFTSYTCYNAECSLYVGPYCSSDGSAIHMGSFIDESCSRPAPSGTYESYNYGQSLPYSNTPLVSDDCIACNVTRNDEDDEDVELLELCTDLYEGAIKCEENLTAVQYPDTGGCYYMQQVLPTMSTLYEQTQSAYSMAMYYSFFPLAAIGIAAFARRMYTKDNRINLSEQGIESGVMA